MRSRLSNVRVARRVGAHVLGALALLGCGTAVEAEEPGFRAGTAELMEDGAVRIREDSAPFIVVEPVGEDAVATLVRAPGRVAFRDGAVSQVGAPVDGRVTEVHVRVGQRVAEGDPLVTIASPSAAQVRGQLAGARVTVAAAEAEVGRQEAMRSAGVGVGADHARAAATLAEARALLSALTASAGSIGRGSAASVVVRAPIAGTVLERRATVGATTSAGSESLITLGEPGAVWIVAEVFERELPLVTEGSVAHVTVASVPHPVDAHVDSIGGAVDPITRRAHVYLTLDAPVLDARAGMYARAEIEVGDAGIGIPASAVLIRDGGRTVVFVQREERTYVSREVEVGAPVGGRAPLLAGLSRGEQIVTRGALLLDGQAELLR